MSILVERVVSRYKYASGQHELEKLPLGTLVQYQPKPPFGPRIDVIRTKDGWHTVKNRKEHRGLTRGDVQPTKVDTAELVPYYDAAVADNGYIGILEETGIRVGERIHHALTLDALPSGSVIQHKGYQGSEGEPRRYKKEGAAWIQEDTGDTVADSTLFEGMFSVHPGMYLVKGG